SLRIDAEDEKAALAALLRRPQARAEIAAGDPALGEQLIDHAIDGRSGNAEHIARSIDHRAAFGARAQAQIEPDEPVDRAAAPAVPLAARERRDAEAGEWTGLVAPDREDEIAGTQARRIAALDNRQAVGLETQQRDVGGGIAADQGRACALAVWPQHGDVLIALQGFIRGDDQARTPMKAARGKAAAAA